MNNVSRVLEVGAFCGVATLAMAEAMPENGEVVSLEFDPFFVEFGRESRLKSLFGHKISTIVGPAKNSLDEIVRQARSTNFRPFDLVVIDADKTNMNEYFSALWETPGMLKDSAIICVDMTPFKKQAPVRYVKFGLADRWICSSGQDKIDALRKAVKEWESPELVAHEFGGFLVVQPAFGQS